MGNNHAKYYGSNMRKIVILGPEASGKTTLYRLLNGVQKEEVQQLYVPTDKFSNQQVPMLHKGKIIFDLWDLNGKLPHLWGHYFTGGVQGIVYVVENRNLNFEGSYSEVKSAEVENYYKTVQEQILNIVINNFDVPLVIVVNVKDNIEQVDQDEESIEKSPLYNPFFKQDIIITNNWFANNINDKLESPKTDFKIITCNLLKQ